MILSVLETCSTFVLVRGAIIITCHILLYNLATSFLVYFEKMSAESLCYGCVDCGYLEKQESIMCYLR